MTDNNDSNKVNYEANPNDNEEIIDLTDVATKAEDTESSDYKDAEDEKVPELDDDILNSAIDFEDELIEDLEIDNYEEVSDSAKADLAAEFDVSKDSSENKKHEIFIKPEEEADDLGQLIADVIEDSQQETVYKQKNTSDVPDSIPLSSEQVDEALERVIKKMYAEKIDSVLTEVIEKTVSKEIERLKTLLLEDTMD